jgi:D-alanyl-D-alanine carboxypeptidase (penicillin-binding protein 5/6)
MPGGGRGRHRRGAGGSEDQLRALGQQLPGVERPQIAQALAHERARRVMRHAVWFVLVVIIVVYVAVQLLRPVPAPVFRPELAGSVRIPGSLPALPLPASGSTAVAVVGGGSLASSGGGQPVAVGGLIKVLTAYVVLHDHPIGNGESGPAITVTNDTVADYQSGLQDHEQEIAVGAQETLTELQALQGLLIAGANDMGTLLADWDAGGSAAFVTKMNAVARMLGLLSTHAADPNGLDATTVSTAGDLVHLGEVAMAIPTFAELVGAAEATLPMAGVVYNTNFALGRDGIVGIRTGILPASGGCFLFEARQTEAGQQLRLIGAVLGQQTASPTAAAVTAAEALIQAAMAASGPQQVFARGASVGRIDAPWGASVEVVPSTDPTVVAWPGLTVSATTKRQRLSSNIAGGTTVGTEVLEIAGQRVEVDLQAATALRGPSLFWRLTRF